MSEPVVRPARTEELAEVGEVTVAAYRADGFLLAEDTTSDYATVLRDAADRAVHAELLVAVDKDDTVLGTVTAARPGTAYAELAGPDELELRMLAVSPTARGRGIGALLTRAVVARARELGFTRVVLCSMDRMVSAHRLYGRQGFRRVPGRDWRPVPEIRLIAFELELG